MTRSLKLSLLTLLLALTAACGAPSVREGVIPESSAIAPDTGGVAWRNCTFRMAWPEDSEPDWAMDLLLAHQVVGPVLKEQGQNLERWRFHRRASRDMAGHQFTFMYYTSAAQAAGISIAIRQNPLLEDLLQAGVLTLANCQGQEKPYPSRYR